MTWRLVLQLLVGQVGMGNLLREVIGHMIVARACYYSKGVVALAIPYPRFLVPRCIGVLGMTEGVAAMVRPFGLAQGRHFDKLSAGRLRMAVYPTPDSSALHSSE